MTWVEEENSFFFSIDIKKWIFFISVTVLKPFFFFLLVGIEYWDCVDVNRATLHRKLKRK